MVETVHYPKMSLPKAIPVKCFVPRHPLVKVSAKSVGRLGRKEKKTNKQTKQSNGSASYFFPALNFYSDLGLSLQSCASR